MKQIVDNFSKTAEGYAAFRPQSPDSVYDFIFAHTPAFDTAWDCGTGNGQVAIRLAEQFVKVYGTDISAPQLARATQADNIIYREERAEITSIPPRTVDLITVGQAIHWFDFEAFYNEVRRVAKPGALLAAWTYTNLRMTDALNEVMDHFYMVTTRAYWDPERKWVDERYATIPFPFREIKAPTMDIIVHWNFDQLWGYLHTWSGVQNYIKKEGVDPLLLIEEELLTAWGDDELLTVRFPVYIRAGYVD